MKRPGSVILAVALAFLVGFALALWAPWQESQAVTEAPAAEDTTATFVLPVAAQQTWFPPMEEYDTGGEALADEKFDELLATFKERMEAEETLADFEREAGVYIHSFIRRLQMPELTPEQTEKTYAYFEELAERHPEQKSMIKSRRDSLEKYYAAANERASPFSIAAGHWFADAGDFDTGGEPFADDAISQLIGMLDTLLTMPETVADFGKEAGIHFWRFGNRLQKGHLTEDQTARVVAYFNEMEARHPDSAEMISRNRFQVQNLLPGRTAPNIVGKDLEGVEFALNDYRDNIAIIYFSGQWCGPCRSEYPYQRFMLELYKDDPVAILGVNSDEEIETILEAKEEEGLDYRVWWDGHGEVGTKGPIATEWNVTGWPSIYILDENGVIRYAQKRHADVITSVNELLWERRAREREETANSEA